MSLSTSTSSSTSSSQFSNLAQQTDSHSCDTLPPARPSSPSFTVSEDQWSSPPPPSPPHPSLDLPSTILSQPTPRKLCIRHQRIADEGTNLKLQQVRVVAPPFAPYSFPFPNRFHPLSYYVSRTPLLCGPIYAFFPYILPRPLTSFRLEKENPSMRSGQAFRHPRTLAESLFFGAS